MRDLIKLVEGLNDTDNLHGMVQAVMAGHSLWVAKTPGDGSVTRTENVLNKSSGLHVFRIMTSALGKWSGTEGGGVDIDVGKFHAPTVLIIDVDAPLHDAAAAAIAKAFDESRGTETRMVMVSPPGSVSDYPELMQRFGNPINL